MLQKEPYRISVTGPEATGKSVLSEQLARHFGTAWVPEYARSYLENLPGKYDYEDLRMIAEGQYNAENYLVKSAKNYLFCDTDMLVIYIWSIDKFSKCDPWIEEQLEAGRYDFYLLCNTDLPWQPDPLREDPHRREELFRRYLTELEERGFRYGVVTGTGDERLWNAIKLVSRTFG